MNKLKQILKRASAGSDWVLAGSPLNVLTFPVSTIGGIIHGYAADTKDTDLAEMNEKPAKAALPGVAVSRSIRRQKAAPGSNGWRVFASRATNPLGPVLLLAAAGMGIGNLVGKLSKKSERDRMEDSLTGALVGGAAGGVLSTLGNLGGALYGLNVRKKTREEHEDAERNYSHARAVVDPFYNGYHIGRRLQASNRPRVSKEEHLGTPLNVES